MSALLAQHFRKPYSLHSHSIGGVWDAKTSLQVYSVVENSNRVHDLQQCQDFFLSKVKTLIPFDFWLSGVAYDATNVNQVININATSLAVCDSNTHNSWIHLFRMLIDQSCITQPAVVSHIGHNNALSNPNAANITIRQFFSDNIYQIAVIDPISKFSTYHCIGLQSFSGSKHLYQQIFNEIMPSIQKALYKSLSNANKATFAYKPMTNREQQILHFMSLGESNPDIARRLGSSACTVKNQVHSILQKLKAANRTQAITKALSLGLIQPLH